jgi:hypothetical protein
VLHSAPDLHITIVAAGGTSEIALTHEIEMVKAALLYADQATLASPRLAMLSMVEAMGNLDDTELDALLLGMGDHVGGGLGFAAQYEAIRRKKYKTRDELLILKKTERQLVDSRLFAMKCGVL